jgi:exosome complex RNA-binding protein Csl4
LGDAHSYLLTTAENELGVVMATSEAGKMLFMNTNINNY